MADKYVNATGVQTIKTWIEGKFALDADLDALSDRVEEIIAEGGEPNVIEKVKVNGVELTPDANKAVNIEVSGMHMSGTGASFTDTSGNSLIISANNDPKTGDATSVSFAGDGVSFDHDVPTVESMRAYVNTNGGKINKIKVNGTEQTITNKEVDIKVPTLTYSADTMTLQDDSNNQSIAFHYIESDKRIGINTESAWSEYVPTVEGMQDYVSENGGKINVIKVNGTAQTITNKEVDLTVPTKLSELENDGDGTTGSTFPTTAEMEEAIESALVGALKPKGSIPFASLPALTAANLNNLYDITDAFTTTADFVEGAGKNYPAGTNVAIINTGTDANPVYKYDTYVGVHDLSAYWTSTTGQTNTLEAMTVAEINAILDPTTP